MILLDVASSILLVIPEFYALFSILIVFVEAYVLNKTASYNNYRQALLHAFVVNLVSSLIGLLLLDWIDDSYIKLMALWVLTICIETPLLFVMNRVQPRKSLLRASVFMNIATYLILFLIILLK